MLRSPHRAVSPSVPHRWRGTSSREVCQEGHFFCTELLTHVSRITAFYQWESVHIGQIGNKANGRCSELQSSYQERLAALPRHRLAWRRAQLEAGMGWCWCSSFLPNPSPLSTAPGGQRGLNKPVVICWGEAASQALPAPEATRGTSPNPVGENPLAPGGNSIGLNA